MRRPSAREDGGASALEYILVLALLAGIVVALTSSTVMSRSGIAITTAVCRLFAAADSGATGCPGGSGPLPPTGAPTAPCVRSSTGATLELEVNVLFVDLGTGEGFVLEELSNGRWKVTWAKTTEGGATAALVQGEGTVRVGNRTFGVGADVSASGALRWTEGDARTFGSEDAAIDYVVDRGIDEGIEALPPGPQQIAEAGRGVVDWITGNDRDDGEDNEDSAQLGIRGDAEASGTAGPLNAEVAAAAEGAVKVTQKENGERRIALILSSEASANLGIPVLAEAGANGSGIYTVEFTVDPQGTVTRLKFSVVTKGAVEVSALTRRDNPQQALREAGASLTGSEGDRTVVDYTIQLDTPELQGAALTFLQQAPRAGAEAVTGDTSRLEQAAGDLWTDGLDSASIISVRQYRDEELGGGIAAKLRVLDVGGGGAADLSIATTRLRDAVYWDTTNGGFVPDTACTG